MKTLIDAVKKVNSDNGCVKSFSVLSCKKVLVEWVFGMSFDDHEESFVTLHNRKQTKLILEMLDQKHEMEGEYRD